MTSITGKKTGFERLVRFAGGGAFLIAIIGLILFSPISASGQDGNYRYGAGDGGRHSGDRSHFGRHYVGADPEGHVEFLEIVLDLSEKQAEEISGIFAELHEKRMKFDNGRMMAWNRGKGTYGRHEARRNRVHRYSDCDRVERVEMRGRMRRERRELNEQREKFQGRMDKLRKETEEKLATVLDDDQMNKLRELHELREDHREERQERRGR